MKKKIAVALTALCLLFSCFTAGCKKAPEYIDVALPDYSMPTQNAYGEKPDLDYMTIDGVMDESENWTENTPFSYTYDGMTVTVYSKFSKGGTYWFITAYDPLGAEYVGHNNFDYQTTYCYKVTNATYTNENQAFYMLGDVHNFRPREEYVNETVKLIENEDGSTLTCVESYVQWDELSMTQDGDLSKVCYVTELSYKKYNFARNGSGTTTKIIIDKTGFCGFVS